MQPIPTSERIEVFQCIFERMYIILVVQVVAGAGKEFVNEGDHMTLAPTLPWPLQPKLGSKGSFAGRLTPLKLLCGNQ